MKRLFARIVAISLALVPLVARGADAPAAKARVYVGLVADEVSAPCAGLLVRAVAPDSPAHAAGIRPGDVVLTVAGKDVRTRRAMGEVVKNRSAGTRISVEILRGEKRLVMQVELKLRPTGSARVQRMDEAVGADRPARAITVPEDIRAEIRRIRRRILKQLAALPEGMQAGYVTDELQALRDLARDTNAGRSGWMSGRAGEITIRFKDEDGSVVLHGANNQLELVLLDEYGRELARYPLNSKEECSALPDSLLLRLRRMR